MSDYVIEVSNVTKRFRLHKERNQSLKDKLIYFGRAKFDEFTALDNVSLAVRRGVTIGLIGSNGSGKSTLLKVISRILYPDAGKIYVNGKVSSLLELGAGFHPDFTGRENIFLNAALLGLTKKEINYKLDEVVDFSELGNFIDEPVRSYSSGMYMRLAFSVAVAVEPQILLIDEILAVGDAAFQEKCLLRLTDLKRKSTTIVLVTHNSSIITDFCDEAVWLEQSKIVQQGLPKDCVDDYLTYIMAK